MSVSTLNEALAHELQHQGVRAVFGLIGEDVVRLALELERLGITYYGARHEAGAVGMADGYSRVTGDLGVALISRGPGMTNALTAIATAAKIGSRLLVIAGDSERSMRGTVYSKWIDQPALYDAAAVGYVTVDDAHSAVADLASICGRVRAGVTIVAAFPGDILEEEAGAAPSRVALPADPSGGEPAHETISYLADLLVESWAFRRPVILAGRGAVTSGAKADLQRLGEVCGALLGTTMMGRALFAGDEFDIGVCGTFSTDVAIELLLEADTVLAFGSSLDPFTTVNGALFPKARVIRFDRDPCAGSTGSMPVELFVECDARLGAAALASELERRSHRAVGYRVPETAERIASFRPHPPTDEGRPGAPDPRLVMARFEEILPRERAVVTDIGHNCWWPIEYLTVPEPSGFVWPLENFCLAAATGVAVGAAAARPDRLTVYSTGDAAMMMSLSEIETAVRYKLPLLILVINDQALGAELHMLHVWGLPDHLGRVATPSFAAVATALGAEGFTVTSLEDVDALRERMQRLDGPIVVDVRVTDEVRAKTFDTELELAPRAIEGYMRDAARRLDARAATAGAPA
jgi:acetolactate synthase-1/2/3 large subunit